MAALQSGRAAGLLLKASTSAGEGARAGSSPPPSTSTALIAGELCSAAAETRTLTVMAFGLLAPAATPSLEVQVKVDAAMAPVQTHPVPVGTASSTRPAGRRSRTM